MAKAFWKGAITFGLVTIPVRMYLATRTQPLPFHLLHKKCLTAIKQRLYCEKDEEYFPIKDTVRGYEYARGKYAVLTESDFERVPVNTTHAIEIAGFARPEEIDLVYFSGSHYLEPEELAVKPFHLLREALRQANRVGVAGVTFQKREHLCCLRPADSLLVLHTLHYQDEVVPREEITVPGAAFTAPEMEMARSLIKAMERPFRAADYSDQYRAALKKLVDARVRGEEIKVAAAPKEEKIPDLMTALRVSIAAARKESARKEPARAGGV